MTEGSVAGNSGTEKLFYHDSHQKTFTAVVKACVEKNGRFEVELDRTAFFPEGGGQYADTGVLDGVRVLDVQEEQERVVHITDGPLVPGQQVEGRIDWDERFMKMQQHTGEHIVSGLVHSRFGYHNVGFHLGSTDCTMDFDGEITKEELGAIENEANRAVWKNLEVQVLYPSREELEDMEYRSKIEIQGQVRIVVIPGYDTCACCAPHVKRTGEIGAIKLTNVQRYKGGVRVTMLCGQRALADYALKQEQSREISALLCARENETADAVQHLWEESAQLKAEIVRLEREVTACWARLIPDDEKTVCIFPGELKSDAMRMLMNQILEKERTLCAVFCGSDKDGYRYVIGSREADMRPLVKEFNGAFDGRGGGRPEMVQGTAHGKQEEMREWILEKAGKIL